MIKDWNLNNNIIIPPNYHLKPTPEAKLWLSNLSKNGMIYEQTGHFQPLRHQILVGLNKGFLTEAYKYTNKADIDFQLPQELSVEGIRERNIIIRRLEMIRNYLKLVEFISVPVMMVSTINFCLAIGMSMILSQFLK